MESKAPDKEGEEVALHVCGCPCAEDGNKEVGAALRLRQRTGFRCISNSKKHGCPRTPSCWRSLLRSDESASPEGPRPQPERKEASKGARGPGAPGRGTAEYCCDLSLCILHPRPLSSQPRNTLLQEAGGTGLSLVRRPSDHWVFGDIPEERTVT